MSESDFAREVKQSLLNVDSNIHISSVESHLTSAGIPDLDVCIDGEENHIELKWSWEDNAPEIRPTQVRWFKNRCKAGGNPWIFAKVWAFNNCQYLLIPGHRMEQLARTKKAVDWIPLAEYVWTGKMSRQDWIKFLQVVFLLIP